MSETVTHRFLDALATLERASDAGPMLELYAEDAELGNLASQRTFRGPDGAREFWDAYRNAFGQVASTFRNVIVADGRAALEWTTSGTSARGEAIDYEGVSILEFEGERVRRFRGFFDPSHLGDQVVTVAPQEALE